MRGLWRPDGVGGLQRRRPAGSAAGQFAGRYLHDQVPGAAGDGEHDLISGLGGQRLGRSLDTWRPFLPGGLDRGRRLHMVTTTASPDRHYRGVYLACRH